MTNKLQQQLYTKYPTIFQDRTKSINQSNMAFGLECGDGWYDLIDKLCSDLMASKNENVIATQVKEKYGRLCFYVQTARDENYKLIYQAEKNSETICEMCGKPGKNEVSKTTWYRTRCKEHREMIAQ